MRLKEIKPGVIHCKTQEEADALVAALGEEEKWSSYWDAYVYATCYKVNETKILTYGPIYCFSKERIIEFSNLIIPDLTPEEVISILGEICKTHPFCGDCPINSLKEIGDECPEVIGKHKGEVMDIMTKWKMKHEKKEPEFEWVDICRIIEVQDNGFKKCVHEEEIKDADLPFGYEKATAENILKKYAKTHSGNYIAVIEPVCRMKQ